MNTHITHGVDIYVHVAFATDAIGSNFALDPFDDATYSGIYYDASEDDSVDYKSYEWDEITPNVQHTQSSNDDTISDAIQEAINATVRAANESATEYTNEIAEGINEDVGTVQKIASNAVPMTNANGSINWDSSTLKIDSHDADNNNFYETEIGGDGIKFRYAQSAEELSKDGAVVAAINQQYMKINKTIVLDEMVIGEWVWQARSDGRLELKWKGSDS